MKVLLTAYCCAPNSGSEQAFGWWWITTCAAAHDVVVLTPACQRDAIEAGLSDEVRRQLRFEYVRGPSRVSASGNANRFERLHQYLWELRAIIPARRIARAWRPDVAQKVTTGTWRVPSCLAYTGTPYILGPLAGSEKPPPALVRSFGMAWWVRERFRSALMQLARWDPLIKRSLDRAALILVAGSQTIADLQQRHPEKAHTYTRAFPHPVISMMPERDAGSERSGPVRLCWVGRLTRSKGLGLLLEAMTDPRLQHYALDVFGDGPDRAKYTETVQRSGLDGRVTFWGHVPQATIWAHIRECDAFVFTSLYDLMGQALSEAMQIGAACVVLDWSGPTLLLGESGGLKVPVSDYGGTVAALASELARLSTERGLIAKLQQAASDRISELMHVLTSADARNGVFESARRGAAPQFPAGR